MSIFIWKGQVRGHEVDAQGIVYHGNYLSYFDNARSLQILELGINWVELSKEGFDLVLIHSELEYYKPLRAFEHFSVSSSPKRKGRLKVCFSQEIRNHENELITRANNVIICIDRSRNKPIAVDKVKEGILSELFS